jgi:hypothetical protein
MNLSDIDLRHGTLFSNVVCRIRHPLRKTATNGARYLICTIEDCGRSLKAYAWPDQCNLGTAVFDLNKVVVSGKIRDFNGGPLATLTSFQRIESGHFEPLQIIPSGMCPDPSLLERFQKIYDMISDETLKQFIALVFSDDSFAIPFITLPASWKHHHSKAGGLMEHSLQCAEMVKAFTTFMEEYSDLAVVAALLHDAGKIVTHNNTGKHSPATWVLDHDALTLEVLAPYLKKLDLIDTDLATALRYIWTWRHHRKGAPHPILTISEAVGAADRISSALDIEKTAFEGVPEWQRFIRKDNKNLLWRPNIRRSGKDFTQELKRIC